MKIWEGLGRFELGLFLAEPKSPYPPIDLICHGTLPLYYLAPLRSRVRGPLPELRQLPTCLWKRDAAPPSSGIRSLVEIHLRAVRKEGIA